tara:strand:+ start:1905 stop:3545 length:1641 start_codon:yes stop_codon:yes gene_type:complete
MKKQKPVKYIFVLGGVLSGLGKGIVASSLGYLLKSRGYKVTIQKLDPYLNVDPGTMNPYQHGEVFVLDDGSETDLDLGHYERFIDENMSSLNTTSAGRVYWNVLNKERQGDYLGDTIQVIPHITNEIKRRIKSVNPRKKFDIVISEVGGTVGDIESQPFVESIRQLRLDIGKENTLVIHTTLLPYINASGEMKTKPTQHSVMRLREVGLDPDLIVCRTENNHHLTSKLKKKIGLFCNVDSEMVFESPDVETIYEIPLVLHNQKFDYSILKKLNLKTQSKHNDIKYLDNFIEKYKNPKHNVNIAICGKYNSLQDSYKSIIEAFVHAGVKNNASIKIHWIDTEKLEENLNSKQTFKNIDGILIPGGFGDRGIEGKILSSQYARENSVPFFGICLGLQCAIIDIARNCCNLKNANSSEFNSKTKFPVVDLMPGQKNVKHKGASMRLGSYSCKLKSKTKVKLLYNKNTIHERHRHRYEVNNKYINTLEKNGLIISGKNTKLNLVEIIEYKNHPWFIASQFHPELKSRILKTHPLFSGFIESAIKYSNGKS